MAISGLWGLSINVLKISSASAKTNPFADTVGMQMSVVMQWMLTYFKWSMAQKEDNGPRNSSKSPIASNANASLAVTTVFALQGSWCLGSGRMRVSDQSCRLHPSRCTGHDTVHFTTLCPRPGRASEQGCHHLHTESNGRDIEPLTKTKTEESTVNCEINLKTWSWALQAER